MKKNNHNKQKKGTVVVKHDVNGKPENIHRKEEKKETKKETKDKTTTTKAYKLARQNRKEELEALTTLMHNKLNDQLNELGATTTRRSNKKYKTALRRARRTRKALKKLEASKLHLTEEKMYNVMVQYDERLYLQVKETIETNKLKPKMTTDHYSYFKDIDTKNLEKLRDLFGKCVFEIMKKKKSVDKDGNVMYETITNSKGVEEKRPVYEMCATGKKLTVWIQATKADIVKETTDEKTKTKKPTNNTTKRKLAAKKMRKTLNAIKAAKRQDVAACKNRTKRDLKKHLKHRKGIGRSVKLAIYAKDLPSKIKAA